MEWIKVDAARLRHGKRLAIFAAAVGEPRNLMDSVRRRLVLVLLMAIVPIAGLSIAQGIAQVRRMEADAVTRLDDGASTAAGDVEFFFSFAARTLAALRTEPGVASGDADCRPTLRGARLTLPFVSNIVVLDPDGTVRCSAVPVAAFAAAGKAATRMAAPQASGFTVSAPTADSLFGKDTLRAELPLGSEGNPAPGAIALGIRLSVLETRMADAPAYKGQVVGLLDSEGRLLASNSPLVAAALFQGLAKRGRVLMDNAGGQWTYITRPLNGAGLDGYKIAAARPTDPPLNRRMLGTAASFAVPVAILIASLVVLWLAVDRIILQWLLYLRRVTAVYTHGHYSFRPTRLDEAPREFRVLGQAVENMARAVRQRDARLREGLAEKTALVREIHHRVKNSLQVVVSLLSLYSANVPHGAEDRRRFEQLRTRVNTLAVVHRLLYEAQEGSEVNLSELLRELASLLEAASDRRLKVNVSAQDVPLPTDSAVPLALMVMELAMTFLPPPGKGPVDMQLSCAEADETVRIELRATGTVASLVTGGGPDLARGFASQLSGTIVFDEEDDFSLAVVTFPARRGRPTPPAD